MSDLYDKIVQERGSLERLVARIPGFRGYQDKQARRTADREIREHLGRLITQRLNRLKRIEKLILDNAGMSYMPRTRDVKGKLQRYHDTVTTAAPGYSAMWAQFKIGPEELERIYSFDEAQMRYVDQIDVVLEALEQAASSKEGLDATIAGVDDVVVEALEAFALRDSLLTNLDKEA